MKILAFESTCDETAVAVVEDGRKVLSDQILSQADLHAVYGGVVPEIASRCHVEVISQLSERALREAGLCRSDIDAVAVSYAPGLIGAVLVGVNFAKSAALALGVPLIPVHHIRGHIAANYLAYPELEPPFLCLAISGGNTLLVDVRDYTDMKILGSTRDDAAGECFDKTARVLGLPYPGGKPIDELSRGGDDGKYAFPIAHVDGNPYDMSFSGLKTAVINLVHNAQQKGEEIDRAGLAGSDGDTHQGLLDISWGRAIPNLEIYAPCDEGSLRDAMLKAAVHDGPTLIRYPRGRIPVQNLAPALNDEGIVKIHDGREWALFAHGSSVGAILEARRLAESEGLPLPAVYEVRKVKPLNSKIIHDCAERYSVLGVMEENYMPGGLGEAVAAIIAEGNFTRPARLVRFGVPDVCVKHATQEEQRELYGLTAEDVIARCKPFLRGHEG